MKKTFKLFASFTIISIALVALAFAIYGFLLTENDFLTQTNPTALPTSAFSTSTSSMLYAESQDVVGNPFRGFYHHTETHSDEYSPLAVSQLQYYREQDNVTIILRVFYLEDFVNSPISDEYLNNIRQDLSIVRQAGFSAILRFTYTDKAEVPYGDAPKDIVLRHISQLAPILQEYSDVVKVVQTGFIGAWGEWYYTDYFVQDPSNPSDISPKDYQDRAEVVSALLQSLPKTTFIQLRTPNYKLQLFPNETLDFGNAYNDNDVSRVGFHNDCFLASPDDYGTYQNENDRKYLSSETLFTPMGGETCNPNPPRSNCPTALVELALFHWSFLNLDYQPDVINNWKTEGCFEKISQNLGYRYVLQRGVFSNQAQQGGELKIELELKNNGWASLFVKTNVEFVVRNLISKREYNFIVSDNPRTWLPSSNSYTISHSLCLPKDIETGRYELFLRLSPAGTKSTSLYSIQFANDLIWEKETGLNDLGHSFEILQGTPETECKSN